MDGLLRVCGQQRPQRRRTDPAGGGPLRTGARQPGPEPTVAQEPNPRPQTVSHLPEPTCPAWTELRQDSG